MTNRVFDAEAKKKTQKILRWIIVAAKLLLMLILLIVFSPFILLWFVTREALFKSSLKQGMRKAGADEEAVRDMSAAFPNIRQFIQQAKSK